MNNLVNATEEEIIIRAKNFESNIEALIKDASKCFKGEATDYDINERYKVLKNAIKEEAKALHAGKDSIADISEIHEAYQKGIRECALYGFKSRTSGHVLSNILQSLQEAEDRLTRYIKLYEQWRQYK